MAQEEVTGALRIGRWLSWLTRREHAEARPLDTTSVHAEHAQFAWASLQRLGISGNDLDDLLQEVFVVVHQRLHTFDGSSPMQAWIFGICKRVAAAHRRRAYVRRERPGATVPEPTSEESGQDPEQAAAARQSSEQLTAILDELELEKRAVFVMFEIDEMPCEEIAAALGVPVGTVYSRLHAARKAFQKALSRSKAREGWRGWP
jgi:RNA polymerase sigma-70 factor (ECF subfamily)